MKIYRSIRLEGNIQGVLIRLGVPAGEASPMLLGDIRYAMAGILPDGVCSYVPAAVYKGRVELGGNPFESVKLSQYMQGCTGALLLGATAGRNIAGQIEKKMDDGHVDSAVVLDAAAAVMADDALGFMMHAWGQANRSKKLLPLKRRFSPGYGDLDLKFQKVLFDMLDAGSIGIGITESYMLEPDKSVFAICGVKQG